MRLTVSSFLLLIPVALGQGACQRATGYCQTSADCSSGLVCNIGNGTCQGAASSDLGTSGDLAGTVQRLGVRINPPIVSAAGDFFGSSVAATSAFAVIGAYLTTKGQGAAYAVDLSGTTAGPAISLPPPLNADALVPYDYFGVSVSAYGNTIAVGASGKDATKGAVYIYSKVGTTLTGPVVKLVAPDTATNDYFGGAVSLYGDTLVVGAASKTGFQGAAYVFSRVNGTWLPGVRVPSPLDGALTTYDYFGQQVATNGAYVAVSAPGRQNSRGAVYLYKYDSTLRTSTQTSMMALASGTGVGAYEQLGGALAMNATSLVIGSPLFSSSANLTAQGIAYLYNLETPGAPTVVTAPGPGTRDRFGASVSLIAGSGSIADTLLIGAPGRNQAFVYSNDLTQWRQAATLDAPAESSRAAFGAAVATAGNQHIVGTRGLMQDVGVAYYFGSADN